MKKALKVILTVVVGAFTILLGIGIVGTILFGDEEYASYDPEWDEFYY